ncbi:hypothetical protein [Crocosphaera sp. XPORK-15E]|uniref:hypothetical protein n=1 Tax=Crocosphaera sp. XPORK-15E TaxID=3110247 RepID=UPI002B1FD7EA|nr:hypothetical protein [Crocosphaera sp. XPORK-15E]MEA5534607.1 hypothetical protein [Crocosphaera sp. XPORK-15E]
MVSIPDSKTSNTEEQTDQILVFLKAKGCNKELKTGLHITPAEKASGKTDISINHDQL